MAFGVDDALNVAGGISSFLGGRSASKAQKEQSRRQSQLLDLQNQNFRNAQQYFQPALQQAAIDAGVYGQDLRGGNGHFGVGNWGNQQDQMRLQQAEEDIARRQKIANNQFRFNANRQGLTEGAQGANLARLAGQGQQQYSQFARQLAIDAPRERERKMQQLLALMGQGFGQGSQAAAGYGQQAGMYGQQASQSYGDLGNIIQQHQYQNMFNKLQNPAQAPVDRGFTGPTSKAPWAQPGYQSNWWDEIE
jgi:hypothetical protein